jgi:hypothetical protein
MPSFRAQGQYPAAGLCGEDFSLLYVPGGEHASRVALGQLPADHSPYRTVAALSIISVVPFRDRARPLRRPV